MLKTALNFILLLVLPCSLFAQDFYDFPQSGLLAANGTLPSGNLALPQLPMGLTGKPVPFVASLGRTADNKWEYSITNNTGKILKIDFEVAQYKQENSITEDGELKKISSVSTRLKVKPGSSAGDKTSIASKADGAALILKSWSLN